MYAIRSYYEVLPVIEPGKSDSASFDNALEMLVASGRSLPHALMMMVPESWNDKNPIPDDLKKFYEFHSTFMEPWDGPASVITSYSIHYTKLYDFPHDCHGMCGINTEVKQNLFKLVCIGIYYWRTIGIFRRLWSDRGYGYRRPPASYNFV